MRSCVRVNSQLNDIGYKFEIYSKPNKEVMDEVFDNEPVIDRPIEFNSKKYEEIDCKVEELEYIIIELKDELFQLSEFMMRDIGSINRRLVKLGVE